MHPSSRWLTALVLLSFSLGCSARGGGGGGGNITPLDAGTTGDSAVGPGDLGGTDSAPPLDRPTPPTDDGVTPFDTGKNPIDDVVSPADLGVPVDVGSPPVCGDARCNGTENCMTCQADCGACAATCGDRTCAATENCTTCPTDCGTCPPVCGDGACNGTETCTSCRRDCGACAPVCGDGSCNGTETCSTCAADCGACPPSCGSLGACGACVTDSRCGWCPFDGACQAGTSSGPSGSSTCSVFGGWVRTASACTAPDAGVRDVGVTDTGSSTSITQSCTSQTQGVSAQCGWRFARTYTCTVGASVVVGCTGGADAGAAATCGTRMGTCTGDPMMRVCPGSEPCATGLTIAGTGTNPADDGCGLCPLGRFTCPAAGSVTVYERAYDSVQSASCSISRGP